MVLLSVLLVLVVTVSSTQDSKVNVINIGLPTGCVAFLLALLVSHYICYRKGHAARRQITAADEEQAAADEEQAAADEEQAAADEEQAPSDDYQFYCEIEVNMGVNPQIQPVSHSHLEEELNLDMPVIADVFPAAPAIVHRDGDTSPESPASSTSRSYTHLIPDVVTDDLTPGDAYLSPVEDVVLPPE
ncbi:uncharacterized protein LOC124269303 isoform X2 [Haliotis rubra]|uniref:uncharacterized protein LOC124269303 isoform X2 n=1 Tax=Haliotis rubra TaxID=36100 RepID=UPI001EE5E3C4|nr:uncharacterized protein LOC124269303 isoform X2 [Haliotis rubra]